MQWYVLHDHLAESCMQSVLSFYPRCMHGTISIAHARKGINDNIACSSFLDTHSENSYLMKIFIISSNVRKIFIVSSMEHHKSSLTTEKFAKCMNIDQIPHSIQHRL